MEEQVQDIEELLETMPETMYDIAVVCTMCKIPHIETVSDSSMEAIEIADTGDKFVVDDEDVPHNYQTAVIEVQRKVIYVPSRNRK
jgi:hypothetical protein